MKIIPVIDLLKGLAVHAVKGQREKYQPLKTALSKSPDPVALASAFKSFGFKELYVADLDAILGKKDNLAIVEKIRKTTGLDLLVDSGTSNLEKAQRTMSHGASKLIVGTETLENLSFVKQAVDYFGNNKITVSLDLKNERILSKSEKIQSMNPIQLALELQNMGITQIILLDIDRVGSNQGVDSHFVKKIVDCLKISVLVGGGIQDLNEIFELKDLGVYGVLAASVFHSGKVTVDDLLRSGLL